MNSIKKKRGRPKKAVALAPPPPVKGPQKNVNGRFVIGDLVGTQEPLDQMFPERMLLINPIASNAFRMRFLRRLDFTLESRDLLAETETRVCEAIYLKGPCIRFLDGKPADDAAVTLFVDGAKILDRAPAEKFSAEDPKIDMEAFVKQSDSSAVYHAGLDTAKQERVGMFLPNGSLVDLHVDTVRRVEVRLVMAEYTTKFGGK